MLIRNARLVPVGGYAIPDEPWDIRLAQSQIVAVEPHLPPLPGEPTIDAAGRWAIPGLWDQHVHMLQWSLTTVRVDTADTNCAEEVTALVRKHLDELDDTDDPHSIVVGFGHRSATWPRAATTLELDDVSGDHPVILISGDAHNGWLNSAAMRLFAIEHRDGPLDENDWFPVFAQMSSLPQLQAQHANAYRKAMRAAAAKGVVGIVDLEFELGYIEWSLRYPEGLDSLRVRTATYGVNLDAVIAAGMRTGDELRGTNGMIHMGPLKIISDGSLNTQTAFCCQKYVSTLMPDEPYGRPNQTPQELQTIMATAHENGLEIAVHAIGDAAVSGALDAFAATGASGTIEHAQLMKREEVARMAELGLAASVQPAHLLDDRDVTDLCWPDRADRCFMFASMLAAGVPVRLGSDAPIAPLDPWLAMAAAVHRSADERDPWNDAEALTTAQALACSTDSQSTLQTGSRPDVVLLDNDPFACEGEGSAAIAAHLQAMPVAATIVADRLVYSHL